MIWLGSYFGLENALAVPRIVKAFALLAHILIGVSMIACKSFGIHLVFRILLILEACRMGVPTGFLFYVTLYHKCPLEYSKNM